MYVVLSLQFLRFLNYLRGEAVASRSAKFNNTCVGPSTYHAWRMLPSWYVVVLPLRTTPS